MLYLIAALGKKYKIGQCQLAGLADLSRIAGLADPFATFRPLLIQNN